MNLKIKLLIVFLIGCFSYTVSAQDNTQTDRNQKQLSEKSGTTHFLLTGYGFAGFKKVGDENSTFGPAGFVPIFLWQKSDRLFFEAEAEFNINDGALDIGLEYATLHYKVAKNLTIGLGKFLSPFGIFGERLHPAWINKFAETPLGFSHDAGVLVGPMTEFGVQFRGGTQLGSSKINYVGYISNGPRLNDGLDEPEEAGLLHFDNLGDNNSNKAIGGRIGIIPFTNSSVEIGISGQSAKVGNSESNYKDISANLFAADFSMIQKIDGLKSNLDIKAQYNSSKVDKANYLNQNNQTYSFENKTSGWFAQATIRPAYIEDKFFKNIEFATRFSGVKTPQNSLWAADNIQTALGINYWLDWNSVLKINFQKTKYNLTDEKKNGFFIQWGLGL